MRRVLLLSAVALGAGCVGTVGDATEEPGSGAGAAAEGEVPAGQPPRGAGTPGSGPAGATGTGAGAGAPAAATPPGSPGAESAGPLPLRRLTRREYNNAATALLGTVVTAAGAFPEDARNEAGFMTPLAVSTLDAQAYMEAAESLAARAVRNLATLLPCDPKATGEAACARRFVEAFGRRAYRRSLEAAEVTDLLGVYEAGRQLGLDFPTGIGLVVQSLLQSPKFLYRWEIAPGARLSREGPLVKLTPHQIVSRLSFLLWGSAPDDKLLDEADAGRIATPADVVAQARRMLGEQARATDALGDFHRQWLDLEGPDGLGSVHKSTKDYPQWTEAARAGARAGLDAFVAGVMLGPQADGRLSSLLLAPVAFVRDATAPLYNLTDVQGSTLVRRELDPERRAGLLTQIAFLATHATPSGSHPTKRGLVIWRNLLCGPVGQLPDEVPPAPAPAPNLTTRERFAMHAQAACASCHRLIDPPGFAFEHYDGIGRYRATEGTRPVDAAGELPLPGGQTVRFRNAVDLVKQLAASDDLRRCVARQWFRYGLGRGEVDADAASIEAAHGRFAQADGDVRELLYALVGSKTFLYRAPDEGEVLP